MPRRITRQGLYSDRETGKGKGENKGKNKGKGKGHKNK
jgi:hypothetical protein